ncbi:DUF3320 domain-containing protein [Phenylobacterium sp.]|uniref:DUF3320 domain-containing protein n=1 Tax=Phenylobacterium sp. TaxID=1871053 RepID=UPI00272FACC6|nr:DUF3320 domain-containing protein [Phenylobacterium sp.]MDP1618657.1 DUF3320 domain-containing protein [Phenylobacterium sp.]MDP1987199.1 DUF3320 domain-containing protein [Phenylobacterium sp.]
MADEAATVRTDDATPSLTPGPGEDERRKTLISALETARDKLLDRSLRNKLINTPLGSSKARQVRVFGRRSDEVFRTLFAGKLMSFAATGAAEPDATEAVEPAARTPPPADDQLEFDAAQGRGRDTRLPTQLTVDGLQKRLLSLYYEGQTLEEEQGVNVLFLALGFLEWREARQSDTPRYAPLILLPVDLARDGAKDRFKLEIRPDDLIANVSLQAWLKENFGIALPDLPEGEDWSPSDYCAQVAAAIGPRPGWSVRTDEILLGFFSFAKFLLWRDLDPANWPKPEMLTGHPLLSHILLRDDEPLEDTPVIGDDGRIDEAFPLAELIHITDADSSQAIAIQEVMAGKNLVIQGPPGTGKSQTITNIIAGAVQRGRSVLFVAEKMAALDVVHQRLVDRKLATICLELHSRKAAKTQVLEQLRQARDAAAPPAWPPASLRTLDETQKRLRGHSDRLHRAGDNGLSAFDLIGRMSLLNDGRARAPQFELPQAASWDEAAIEGARIRAERLGERLASAGVPASHPWRGVGIPAPDMLEQERLAAPMAESLSRLETLAGTNAEVTQRLAADASPTLGETTVWVAALRHLAGRPAQADEILAHPQALDLADDLAKTAAAGARLLAIRGQLEPLIRPEAWRDDWSAQRRILAGQGTSLLRLFSSRYREAVADLRGVWVGKLPKHAARMAALDALMEGQGLAKTVAEAESRLRSWLGAHWKGEATDWRFAAELAAWLKAASTYRPQIDLVSVHALAFAPDAAALAGALEAARQDATTNFETLAARLQLDQAVAFDGRSHHDLSASELANVVGAWNQRLADIVQWPPIREDLAWLAGIGGEPFARQIFEGDIPPTEVEPVLMLAAFEAMWNALRVRDPELGQIQGDELDQLVRRFRQADRDRIRCAADEVARAHLDRQPTGSAGAVGVLKDEMNKSRRLMPVRKLMERAGEAIQRFTPVFLMSPLSIAQYLRPGALQFDLLVIDEASQVRPEDALGAIARCRQVVVVGDDRQLPPTNFFNRMVNDDGPDDDDEEGDETAPDSRVRKAAVKDVESILNLCSRFPERMLRWHYRSEHPALIATSNRNFYKNQLMLPPSVVARAHDGETGLMFHPVASGGYERGRTARNEIEAEAVAQAALRHARERPNLSLGVGTFSVAQRDAVRDRIDDLARKHPELEALMKGGEGREPLFVKNLENIQGDERDVIFISVGYGRDRDGKLTQNFGPVGREGGERRLNVLITRARKRCEVFSSLVAEDIRLEAGGKPGVSALREFLKLAKDGYSDINAPTGRSFDSDFEEAVSHAIQALGFTCHPQVGMAGFFIDLGVIDPANPDRYILGVECDGAAYHSSRYARDRDRLRQQILESRGWKIHRIWSTDWFYRREREVEKLRLAIEAALAGRPLPNADHMYEPLDDGPVTEPDAATVELDLKPDLEPDLEPDWAPPRLNRPAPYIFAALEVEPGDEPHTLPEPRLTDLVAQIVQVEQPIHEDEVARRLASACGLQRAGSRAQQSVKRGLIAGQAQGRLCVDDGFWSAAGETPPAPRDRSALSASDQVRKASMIAPTEIAAAARLVLTENQALEMAELVTETARALGFARTGVDLAAAIDRAIGERLMAELETDYLGRLRLRS